MDKKVLLIKGSPREKGCTNLICEKIIKELKDDSFKVFDTYKESFEPCKACGFCVKNKKCINRDLENFFSFFETADVIIFLSPIYNGTFPAPLKALIDRFQVYFNRFYEAGKVQPIEKKRKAFFVASSGREGREAFSYMENQLKCAFTILNIEYLGGYLIENTDLKINVGQAFENIKRSFTYEKR